MKSLFLKIFLFYWVAQALFLLLAILVTLAVQQRGDFATWQTQQSKVLATAMQIYEESGETPLRRYLDDVRESLHVRVLLFDEQGTEVSGRPLPHWADPMKRGEVPPPRDIWQRLTPSPFRHQVITSASGHPYSVFVVLPPGPFGPEGVPTLFILIGIVSVWFGLLSAGPLPDLAGGALTRRHPASGGWRPERTSGRCVKFLAEG